MSDNDRDDLAAIVYRVNNPHYGDYSTHEETADAILADGWRRAPVADGATAKLRAENERLRAELTDAQRSANVWKTQTEQWERDHQNTVLPYTAKIEGERDDLQARIDKALDLHREFKIYDECGHEHEIPEGHQLPDGLHQIEDVGLVCDEGYLYSICRECCADDTYQTEACASDHLHDGDAACWPCPTRAALTEEA